ncbi:hypothetical protein Aph01nite_47930 [Acrocarpospora phusangensis]|uniref:TauD/TfdA-like domain-containing protein n=1 Tax=Acrocarpospora phusangensis TaxID=1070424 RepID=A0A919QD25_9ACTN|nr:TauD/TfdA family dioxygenase [Acrocarpospora phusangensis]GIH26483.1 hypothetical protein Aph01nite_47930 [Acrocarpospora phusangensis]
MQPFYEFSGAERAELAGLLGSVRANPYDDYPSFAAEVAALPAPAYFREVCARIRAERESGVSDVHALRDCPIDEVVPELGDEDPIGDKYARKRTFVGEAFLALFAGLCGTPLMAYGSRNNGDFFTDVVAISRYSGQQTGFSDSELVFHNDRTAHWARADFISLLGMRCPEEEVIYTTFVSGASLLAELAVQEQETLRKPYFHTPFDVYSRDTNTRQTVSEDHPILENGHSFRYVDTVTTVLPEAPPEAKDALISMKNALVRAGKQRHRLSRGDLLVFANQDGLHSRDRIEIVDRERARTRWLLKTYAFRDPEALERLEGRWLNGVPGLVAD